MAQISCSQNCSYYYSSHSYSNHSYSNHAIDPLLEHICSCRWGESLEVLLDSKYEIGKVAATNCQRCGVSIFSSCYQNNAPDEVLRAIANHMLKWSTDEWSTYCANLFSCGNHKEQTLESIVVFAVCYKFPEDVIDKVISFYRGQRNEYNKNRAAIMGDILLRGIGKAGVHRILIDILSCYPECARLPYGGQNLLQQAIKLKYNGVITSLVAANPEAAQNISYFKSVSDSVDIVGATPLAMTIALKMNSETISAVLKAYPLAATVLTTSRANSGETNNYFPFHMAMINGLAEETINELFQMVLLNAKTLRESEQKTPLIYALDQNLPDTYLLQIIEADQEAAKLQYGRPEELILHHVLQDRMLDEVILNILLAFRDAAKVKDADNILPLHYALEQKYSDQVVLELLNCNEEAAVCPIPKTHMMPYQLALLKGYHRVSVVEQLLEPVIELSEKLRLKHKICIFHDILSSDYTENLVLRTLEVDPDSAALAIPQGFWAVVEKHASESIDESKRWVQDVLPLSAAIIKRYPEELIIKIYEKYPNAAKLHDFLRANKDEPIEMSITCYPFWLAKMYGYSDTLVSILFDRLNLEVKTIRESSHGNISPVHDLIDTKVEDKFLIEILQSDSLAVELTYSDNGDLPLHRALKKELSETVLLKIIDLFEHATVIRNHSDQRLPIHEAAMRNTSPKVIERLLSVYPGSLRMKDKYGFFPADLVQAKLPKESITLICHMKKGCISMDKPLDSFSMCDSLSNDIACSPQFNVKEEMNSETVLELSNRILDLEKRILFISGDHGHNEGLAKTEGIEFEILDDVNKRLLDINRRFAAIEKVLEVTRASRQDSVKDTNTGSISNCESDNESNVVLNWPY